MESNSQKIIAIITEIITLLEMADVSDADYYKRFLQYILKKLNAPHELDKIAQEILNIYGGMGSFNDVAIWKNGKVLDKEHDEFECFSEQLFLLCRDIVIASRRGETNASANDD